MQLEAQYVASEVQATERGKLGALRPEQAHAGQAESEPGDDAEHVPRQRLTNVAAGRDVSEGNISKIPIGGPKAESTEREHQEQMRASPSPQEAIVDFGMAQDEREVNADGRNQQHD